MNVREEPEKPNPEELEEVVVLAEEDDDPIVEIPGGEEAGDDSDDEAGSDARLDELLARRSARPADTSDSEETIHDFAGFPPDGDRAADEALAGRVVPIKDRREFVCNRCHLVKAKTQLADSERVLCRDCV
jgi:Domain of unknown function (DUF4193)